MKKIRFRGFLNKWKKAVAGDFLEGKNGFAFASKDYKLDGKFSVLTIKNVQGDKTIDVQNLTKVDKIPLGVQEHQKLKVGDILISMTGNVGRVSMVHIENCLLNQRVGLIAPNNKIYKEFLYWMLKTDSFINTMESKATSIQKNISLKSVEEYSFFLPPTIQEQQKIAEFLSTIDELETTLKNQLEQVELMKKYYLEKLFPKKDADIPNLRFEYFKSESWKPTTLKSMFLNKSVLIKTATKKYLKENIFTVGLFPVIDQGQTYINGYVNETSFLIPKNEYLIFGDHTEIFKFVNFSFCQGGDGLKIIECNSNFFSLRFLFYSLVSNYKIVGGYSRHFKYLVETKISIPSAFQEQQKIADFLSTIDEQAESLKNQLSNIQEMKKYYLRSLFF